jgi:hypothetical protein
MIPKTFAEIEKEEGIQYSPLGDDDFRSSVTLWYEAVRNKKFSKFNINDLCISIRQNMHIEYLYPYIYAQLKQDINVGEQTDGEMVVSLKAIKKGFWENNKDVKKKTLILIEDNFEKINDYFTKDVNRLLEKLRE